MNSPIEYCTQTSKCPNCQEPLFNSREELVKSIKSIRHGDLYVIGKVWIAALDSVLLGAKINLIPTVSAAPPEKPSKPPPMKYKELSLYQSPHSDYKDDKDSQVYTSPECRDKLMHKYLHPSVKHYKCEALDKLKWLKCEIWKKYKEVHCIVKCQKDDFLNFMRSPKNLMLGRGVVTATALIAFIIGRRTSRFKDSLLRGLFFGGIGALAAGAVCFPKETDENLREFCYHSVSLLFTLTNFFYGTNYWHKTLPPCPEDMPPCPKAKIGEDFCKKKAEAAKRK